MRRFFLSISILAIAAMTATAQTRQEKIADAIALFNSWKYDDARVSLSSIVTDTDRDPKINFYLGAAESMSGVDTDDAIRRLRLAQARNFMKNDANLYLGRAYQLTCDYEQARTALGKFLATPTTDAKKKLAEQFDAECAAATQIASKIFNVKVVAKTTLPKKEILSAYGISKEVGSLCHNADFFQSDIDPDGLMYTTERADAAYFALPDDSGRDKLMKMEKLIGGWGDMTRLQGVDSEDAADDITPVLMTDGQTLYFASNRLGGMGGYDIFRSTYDHETRTFSEPVNMGVPFNSPYDDFLFVPDEFTSRAWFASNRETRQDDTLTVYQIVWDDTVIRSMAQTTDEIRQALALAVDKSAGEAVTASAGGGAAAAASVKSRKKIKDEFRLVVCDTLTYTQWEHFRNPQAASTYKMALAASAEKDSTVKLMAAQRKEFMALTSSLERNAKLQDLLQTERNLYALDDEIADKTESARNAELRTLAELISSGKYTPLCSIKIGKKKEDKRAAAQPSTWLTPEAFSTYSPVFFTEARANEDDDIMDILSETERKSIMLQDSLLAWTQIVTMEADKSDTEHGEELRHKAQALAIKAYDAKSSTYEGAAARLFPTIKGYDTQELGELYDKAHALCIAIEAQTPTEDPVAPHRRAATAYERCLSRYATHASGSFPLPEGENTIDLKGTKKQEPKEVETASNTTSTPEPEPECETPQDVTTHEPEPEGIPDPTPGDAEEPKTETKPTETATAEQPSAPQEINYRIQLGVFRNKPVALAKLPDPSAVTTLFLEERNLTRYYYGGYATQADAKANLDAVHSAGFDGAYVVKAQ